MSGSVSFDKGVGLAIRYIVAGFNAGGTADLISPSRNTDCIPGLFYFIGKCESTFYFDNLSKKSPECTKLNFRRIVTWNF